MRDLFFSSGTGHSLMILAFVIGIVARVFLKMNFYNICGLLSFVIVI